MLYDIDRIKRAIEIVDNYKDVEFHQKDGSIYHAKNVNEFKELLDKSIAQESKRA